MGRLCGIGAVLGTLLVGGCVANVDPLDEAALRAGIPTLEFKWAGFQYGPVRVTMPDGEVLIGEYRILNEESPRRLSARAVGPGGAQMSCEGIAEGTFQATGTCRIGRHKYRFAF